MTVVIYVDTGGATVLDDLLELDVVRLELRTVLGAVEELLIVVVKWVDTGGAAEVDVEVLRALLELDTLRLELSGVLGLLEAWAELEVALPVIVVKWVDTVGVVELDCEDVYVCTLSVELEVGPVVILVTWVDDGGEAEVEL